MDRINYKIMTSYYVYEWNLDIKGIKKVQGVIILKSLNYKVYL